MTPDMGHVAVCFLGLMFAQVIILESALRIFKVLSVRDCGAMSSFFCVLVCLYRARVQQTRKSYLRLLKQSPFVCFGYMCISPPSYIDNIDNIYNIYNICISQVVYCHRSIEACVCIRPCVHR